MTNPSVEAVARALLATEESWNDHEWEYLPPRVQELFRKQARAAIQAIEANRSEIEELREALISSESIERLATDIAIACVDCRDEIREARHRAMVRLGERLRKPLPRDLEFAKSRITKELPE